MSSTSLKMGVSHEYGFRQPATSTHDRGYERAQALCGHAKGSYPRRLQTVRSNSQAVPETATAEEIRRFQLHLAEAGLSICTRNQTMTGLRFLFRVTLRRLDPDNEIYHLREPVKTFSLAPGRPRTCSHPRRQTGKDHA